MDDPKQLVDELASLGITLWVDEGALRFRAPEGALTPLWRERIAQIRPALLEYLSADSAGAMLTTDPAGAFEAFPLTDVQTSYMLGRSNAFRYSGVGCHGYGEIVFEQLDAARLEHAWNRLVDRHAMLRAVMDRDGGQRILEAVTRIEIRPLLATGDGEELRQKVRQEMDHRVYDPTVWPLFDIRMTQSDVDSVVHLSLDFLVADFVSIQILLQELGVLLGNPAAELPPIGLEFRDYIIHQRTALGGPEHERDRAFWMDRLDSLPPAPDLPIVPTADASPGRFSRWQTKLDQQTWTEICQLAARHGVSASSAVLTAFAEVIAKWSRSPHFTLDLTLLDRRPVHPDVNRVVGDFTSIDLLAVKIDGNSSFAVNAAAIQKQLWEDLDHRDFSGVEVVRELARRRGSAGALMPVVFTSAIGVAGEGGEGWSQPGKAGHGISQTPQVWLDCQNMEVDGSLSTNWDVRDGVFPPGLIDDMFNAYEQLLRDLTKGAAWEATDIVALPSDQDLARQRTRQSRRMSYETLHSRVVAQAHRTPDRPAIIDGRGVVLTYRECLARAMAVCAELEGHGVVGGELIAIITERGWEQAVAAIGILLAGGIYVPIDALQPPARRRQMLDDAGIEIALTQSWIQTEHPADVATIAVDRIDPHLDPLAQEVEPGDPAMPAYVIYTSGSTGAPKGVVITHQAALNTIEDLEERFDLGPDDHVLGLANLGFDLSVFDIFSPLGTGASLVVPVHARRADPSHWAELLESHRVRTWDTVPALAGMLAEYLAFVGPTQASSLRRIMMSGDWIPIDLPGTLRTLLPQAALFSLGGATEASIWSVIHPISEGFEEWPSVPYGTPLTNQFLDVLDLCGHSRPDWVPGSLVIEGQGVALGYYGDPERTKKRFTTNEQTGDPRYDTGDIARWRPGGILEFLGREDDQVKIRGHRIELGEIEAAARSHSGVANATALAVGSTATRHLALAVEGQRRQEQPAPSRLDVDALKSELAQITGKTDPEVYAQYMKALNDLGLAAMRDAFVELGLPINSPTDQIPALAESAGVLPRYHRLLCRWNVYLRNCRDLDGFAPRPVSEEKARNLGELIGEPEALIDYFSESANSLSDQLTGRVDPLDLLFPAGDSKVTRGLYEETLFNKWANAAAGSIVRYLLQRNYPDRNVTVLEVGAGSGGTTEWLLPELRAGDRFVYTDVSSFFLEQGTNRFGEADHVIFKSLDLNKNLGPQGINPNTIDIVVAGDVIHATTDIDATLRRLREAMRPGGHLVLIEMTTDHPQIMSSLELLLDVAGGSRDFTDARQGGTTTFLDGDAWDGLIGVAGGRQEAELGSDVPLIRETGIQVRSYVFKEGVEPVDEDVLAATLRARLPEYMVPHVIWIVDEIPFSHNGKVDRARLARDLSHAESETPPEALPAGPDEEAVAEAWSRVLGRPTVGRNDNFFEAGGDSLTAARLATTIAENVPAAEGFFFDEILQLVLEKPTVAEFCEALFAPQAGTPQVSTSEDVSGPVLRELGGAEEGEPYVIIPGLVDIDGTTVEALRASGPVFTLRPQRPTSAAEVWEWTRAAANAIADAALGAVTIVGSGAGALLAPLLATEVVERGVTVADVVLLGGSPSPTGMPDDRTLLALWACEVGVPRDVAWTGTTVRGAPEPDTAALRQLGQSLRPDSDQDGEIAALRALFEADSASSSIYAGDVFVVWSRTDGLPLLGDVDSLGATLSSRVLGNVTIVEAPAGSLLVDALDAADDPSATPGLS